MFEHEQYAKCGKVRSAIKRECTLVGESIEEMIMRCTESNEPIDAKAPMIYTEEADGVMPQYDPRTDRFEIALDAVDKYQKSQVAKTDEHGENQQSAQAETTDITE